MNSMQRQKNRTLNDELPRSGGAQYATEEGVERTPERMESNLKQHSVVDMTGNGSKVLCCKEQYSTGT